MTWIRRVLAHFAPTAQVAKPSALPKATQELVKESQEIRRDLRELRRFEIVVRRR